MGNIELQMANMLAEVLEVDVRQISLHTHFFEQGVDSLIALRFARKIQDEFGVSLDLETFYDYPCLNELALYLNESILKQNNSTD